MRPIQDNKYNYPLTHTLQLIQVGSWLEGGHSSQPAELFTDTINFVFSKLLWVLPKGIVGEGDSSLALRLAGMCLAYVSGFYLTH